MCMQKDKVWVECNHRAFFRFEPCVRFGRGCFGAGGDHEEVPVQDICSDCKRKDPNPAAREADRLRREMELRARRAEEERIAEIKRQQSEARRKRSAPTDITNSRTTRATRSSSRRTAAKDDKDDTIPDLVKEMVVEVRKGRKTMTEDQDIQEPPRKRKRPGEKPAKPLKKDAANDSNDEDLEFEDVPIPAPTIQTMVRDTDDEEDDDDDDIQFEDVNINGAGASARYEGPKTLNLDLTAFMAASTPKKGDRRKALGREEKDRRIEAHKVHLLCLLAHVELRNRWCSDPEVQDALRPLLSQKTVGFLLPRASLNQFSRTESFKRGLSEAKEAFKTRFEITERGLQRALWADNIDQLKDYKPPPDAETTRDKADFLKAAQTLKGSRDVGAQLFCALLRSVGVEARLVCSLQPLACVPGAPTMPKQSKLTTKPKQPSKAEQYLAAMAKHETKFTPTSGTIPRSRLGHPDATGYNVPSLLAPSSPAPPPVPKIPIKKIKNESPFPVYWVEVLDHAHQKYHPVDPLVTFSQFNTKVYEPPSSDLLNSLTYVIAFNPDSTCLDVTRRYAKAYNSKTRRWRIDGLVSSRNGLRGERWLRSALRRYQPPFISDLLQIELNELKAIEIKEPMPRNVMDFKDHPVYALERHLRRNEVLVPGAQVSGTVSAGAKAPLERIYRRREVKVARTREKWYRLGRVVLPDEEPVKILPKIKRKRKGGLDSDDDGDGDGGGNPAFIESQTELYVPPPVVNGKVPKNKFGNLDVYVPSMVPRGGVHIPHEKARQAGFILGVDYAPALTGFEFRGRHGTAVLRGVVVPEECEKAMEAVIQGLEEMEVEEEEERKRRGVLRLWRRMLKGLGIWERIMEGVDEEAEAAAAEASMQKDKGKEVEMRDVDGSAGPFHDDDDDDEDEGGGGGGFFPTANLDSEDEGGGGFMAEEDEGGGFMIE
ncbi:putative DNA repair protein rhp41 [Triangularia verruculosa]|uniref:DNA repair protein rhp41 n=1 Tax=Triangularia verruculosa TaxID=2587418 RepID=A0AAN6XJG0_9PEZI|nr:putative DNA repair protein rhp41 [Triangularia verruculosa]